MCSEDNEVLWIQFLVSEKSRKPAHNLQVSCYNLPEGGNFSRFYLYVINQAGKVFFSYYSLTLLAQKIIRSIDIWVPSHKRFLRY